MLLNHNFLILLSSLIYALLSIIFSYYSYPQEDALILFRYANNLAESGMITFNLYGELAEGGTDFLWLVILAIFKSLGIDTFVSTIIFSSISLAIISKIIIEEIAPNKNNYFYILILIIFLNIGQIVGASILGFSTLIFCTIGLLLYKYAYHQNMKAWVFLSIIFCLFRPEAVIFFIPTIFMVFQKDNIKSFLTHLLIIVIVGAAYFIWRYLYFSELLPLPLMVKQIGGELSLQRLFATISMFTSTLTISLVIPILIYIVQYRKEFFSLKNKNLYFFSIILIFAFLYIFSISTGYSSQNIFFRYFAPIYFIIFIMSVYSLSKIGSKLLIFSLILLTFGSIDNSNLINRILDIENRKISHPTYRAIYREFTEKSFRNHPLVQMGNSLGAIKNNKFTIMLTEAGAIPYLSNSKVIDMAGLNTKEYAKNPVTCEDFNNIKPDLIEIDVGIVSQFNYKAIVENESIPSCGFIDKDYLYEDDNVLDKDLLFLIDTYHNDLYDENHLNATVRVAAFNTLFCMKDNELYDEVFINKKSDQIFFLNSSNNIKNAVINSCNIDKHGYFN